MTTITISKLIRLAAATTLCGALFALTYFVYGRVFEMRPVTGDNLYILSWADRAVRSQTPSRMPGVRPVATRSKGRNGVERGRQAR